MELVGQHFKYQNQEFFGLEQKKVGIKTVIKTNTKLLVLFESDFDNVEILPFKEIVKIEPKKKPRFRKKRETNPVEKTKLRHDEWKESQDQFIKDKYPEWSFLQIGKLLGRTEGAVQQRAHKLGVGNKKWHWSTEADERIKTDYPDGDIKELCLDLGRNIVAVRLRASFLKVKRNMKNGKPKAL